MRAVLYVIGGVLGAYLVARAVAEPFIIDVGDPATYANNWGGPSLPGVLAVHCGPGALVLAVALLLCGRGCRCVGVRLAGLAERDRRVRH